MSRSNRIAEKASVLAALSFVSPLAGMLAEMTIAGTFGMTAVIDVYRVCALLLILANQLLFGQVVANGLIPVLSAHRSRGDELACWRSAFTIGSLMLLLALPVIGMLLVFPEAALRFLGPGLSESAVANGQWLVRCVGFSFLLLIPTGVIHALLHTHDVFWVNPVAQVGNNLLLIAALLIFGSSYGADALATAILAGAAVRLMVHLARLPPLAALYGVRARSALRLAPGGTARPFVILSLPLIAMVVFGQWWSVVLFRELSWLHEGAIATFGYAYKVLIMGVILSYSVIQVVFPRMSLASARANAHELAGIIEKSVRMTLYLGAICAALIFTARQPLTRVLYLHGTMSVQGAMQIASMLGVLVFLIPCLVLTGMLSKVWYAMGSAIVPTVAQAFQAILIVSLLGPVVRRWGIEGAVAVIVGAHLATAILMLLFTALRRQVPRPGDIAKFLVRLGITAAVAAVAGWAAQTGVAAGGQMVLPSWSGTTAPPPHSLADLLFLLVAGLTCALAFHIAGTRLGLQEPALMAAHAKHRLESLRIRRSRPST